MVKIGDFAKIARVSVKALRYYAEIGLLQPIHVDHATGYRYYSASQLPALNRILVYKNLGFSLDQTQTLIRVDASSDKLRDLLRERQADLARKLESEQLQLADVEARIRQIEREGRMPKYEVLVKEAGTRDVVSVRRTLPDYAALDALFREMAAPLPKSSIDGFGAIWYECAFSGTKIDCEALVFLKAGTYSNTSRLLPRVTVASVVHQDTDSDPFPEVYRAVLETIDSAGLEILWPMRELYFTGSDGGRNVTEIQFPVRKLSAA